MASYELSGPADRDLTDIYTYSFQEFGESTADNYLLGLLDCFVQLAAKPERGRRIDSLRSGYFRFEFRSHVVFYLKIDGGIRIVRVLHVRMDLSAMSEACSQASATDWPNCFNERKRAPPRPIGCCICDVSRPD